MNSKWKIPKESRFGIALKSSRRVAWGRSDVLFRAILICVSDGACEIKRKASCVCENLLSSSEKRKIIGVLTAFRFLSESLSEALDVCAAPAGLNRNSAHSCSWIYPKISRCESRVDGQIKMYTDSIDARQLNLAPHSIRIRLFSTQYVTILLWRYRWCPTQKKIKLCCCLLSSLFIPPFASILSASCDRLCLKKIINQIRRQKKFSFFVCGWIWFTKKKKKFFSNRISLCRAEKRVGLATHNNFEIGNSIQYFYMFFELPASPASNLTVIFHLFSSFCFCFVRKTIMLWISIEVYRSFITYCQTFFSGVPHTINADTRVHFSVIDETHNGNDEWIIWF